MTLAFPSYDFLKSIKQEKDITLFTVYGDMYGRLRVNEDNCPGFYFDLMQNGHSGENEWTKFFVANKKGYDALQIHAQKCYSLILNNLVNQTHDWQNEQRDFEFRKATDNSKYDFTWRKKNR